MSRPKKSVAAIAFWLIISSAALSQQDDPGQLATNRDKKLASPFLRCSPWTTGFDQARAVAKESGKLILAYFTRSYAPCGPCLQIEQTVFARPEFADFSRCLVLFCHVSTRIPSDPNDFLFAEKGGTAFPTLMVLDASGNVLARQCGERSMRAVREVVEEARSFANLIRRAETGDAGTRYECLSKQIEYGHFDPDVARARVDELGSLPADRRSWFEGMIVSHEYSAALLDIRKAADDAGRLQAARKLVEMKNAGHVPSGANILPFWDWVMAYAASTRDLRLFEDGLAATKLLVLSNAATRDFLQEKEDAFDRLKRAIRAEGAGVVQKH